MTSDDREAEDVTGLFRKFGGDAKGYKEFEPAPVVGQPQAAWPLIPGSQQGAPAPVPAPVAATPPAPAPMPAPAPAPVAVPTPSPLSGNPRELDLLFARLAGQPSPASAAGHGLMSRWRKPS